MTDSMVGRELRIPAHLSQSQVNSYQHCPRQYVLERGLKVPSRPAWALAGGSAVHEATEEYDRALHAGTDMDDELVKETFHLALENQIAETEKWTDFKREDFRASGRASKQWPNKEDYEWWRANGPSMCLSWKSWRATSPWELAEVPDLETGEMVPAIELVFDMDLGDGVTVKGAIDRLFTYQGLTGVLDLKSGAREPQSSSQLKTYALAMSKCYGLKMDWGCYWMARTGATTTPVSMVPLDTAGIEYDFRTTRKSIDARLFPAKVSNMCSACPVRAFCYAQNGERAGEIPLDFPVESV
jgi:putative RecB family exonuclease